MQYLILTAILSGTGIAFMFARHLLAVRALPEDEFLSRLKFSEPIFSNFQHFVVITSGKFWQNKVLPKFRRQKGWLISRFRKIVFRLGNTLLRFDDYLYGKTNSKPNGNGPNKYWDDINEFKNDLNKK